MRVLRQLATSAAHPSKKTDALSLARRGRCFFDLGKPRQGEGRVASLPWTNRIEAALWRLHNSKRRLTMTSKPTLIAYTVKERGKGRNAKAIWVRIGGAWPFESGAPGFTIQLDALPLDGRIVLAEPKAEVDPADAVPEIETR
jgi:hypothetical protein